MCAITPVYFLWNHYFLDVIYLSPHCWVTRSNSLFTRQNLGNVSLLSSWRCCSVKPILSPYCAAVDQDSGTCWRVGVGSPQYSSFGILLTLTWKNLSIRSLSIPVHSLLKVCRKLSRYNNSAGNSTSRHHITIKSTQLFLCDVTWFFSLFFF